MKLKPILVLLGMFTCSWLNSYSQVFAHQGARWIFHRSSTFGMCSLYYEIAEYTGDTVILGIQAKKIKFTTKTQSLVPPNNWTTNTGYRYYKVVGDTVFIFTPSNPGWQELYNFSVQVGDSMPSPWANPINVFSYCDSLPYTQKSVVTATGTTLIAGENLRYYTVKYLAGDTTYLHQTFYERIITNTYWFPTDTYWCGAVYECNNPDFLCYKDDDMLTDSTCINIDSIQTLSIPETYQENDIRIYPNPVSQSLTISGAEQNMFIVFNIDGKVVLSSTSNIIHVENLPSGIYIITSSDYSWYKRIVKN